MTSRRLLVTGAAGFVGQHLLDTLGPSAGPIVGWYRPGGPPPAQRPAVTWAAVELTDRVAVRNAVRDAAPDAVFHLAAAPSVRTSWQNPVPHLKTNVLGTHFLLEALRTLRPTARVLVVSSAQVYQMTGVPCREDSRLRPESPYGLSKLGQEQLALRAGQADGLDIVVARPFNHIGPGQAPEFAVSHFARQIARIEAGLEPPVLRVGNLDARRDTTDVRDVARAYVSIVERSRRGSIYNVCSGQAPTMRDLLDGLCRLSSTSVTVTLDPSRLRPNDVPLVVGDASRIASELDWSPRIPLEQTLADTLDAWRAQVRSAG